MKSLIETVRATVSKQALEEKYQADISEQDVEHICESKYHVCAVVVEHPEWGEGKPLIGRHAEPDDEGNVAWYDVEFAHGIEEKVEAEGLNILDEMSHGKKKKTEGNAFTAALMAARKAGDDTFVVGNKTYNCEDYDEEGNVKEAMDPVDPKAVKKDFKDRKDKDIDNDGDVDDSDEYLHKKRKAISKSTKKNEDEPDGEKGETATMNPKKEQKESTIRNKLMSIWEDAAGAKRKKDQNRDEQPTDRNASAKTMKDGHPVDTTSKLTDYDELGHDDASKAGRAGPSAKPRTNDSKIGDKAIINKIANAYKGMKNGD